eukprot:4708608-Prymnesium_polylepis.2
MFCVRILSRRHPTSAGRGAGPPIPKKPRGPPVRADERACDAEHHVGRHADIRFRAETGAECRLARELVAQPLDQQPRTDEENLRACLLYTSPSPRDAHES